MQVTFRFIGEQRVGGLQSRCMYVLDQLHCWRQRLHDTIVIRQPDLHLDQSMHKRSFRMSQRQIHIRHPANCQWVVFSSRANDSPLPPDPAEIKVAQMHRKPIRQPPRNFNVDPASDPCIQLSDGLSDGVGHTGAVNQT